MEDTRPKFMYITEYRQYVTGTHTESARGVLVTLLALAGTHFADNHTISYHFLHLTSVAQDIPSTRIGSYKRYKKQ